MLLSTKWKESYLLPAKLSAAANVLDKPVLS